MWETKTKEICYTVCKPVYETRERDICYTVCKPVHETKTIKVCCGHWETQVTECPGRVITKCVQEPGCWTWDPCCCRCVYSPVPLQAGPDPVPASQGLQEGLGAGNSGASGSVREVCA